MSRIDTVGFIVGQSNKVPLSREFGVNYNLKYSVMMLLRLNWEQTKHQDPM